MNDEQNREIKPRRKRKRSPAYPAIDLEEALQRAQQLQRVEGEHWAPIDVVLGHWGYKPGSGLGLVLIAALKRFGLLVDEGTGPNRRARLSERALDIIKDAREVSPERDEAIREAALAPKIHAELWDEYSGKLPSDASLMFALERTRGFSENGAREFIAEFRRTIEYARLNEPSTVSTAESGSYQPDLNPQMTPPDGQVGAETISSDLPAEAHNQDVRSVEIPLPTAPWPVLRARIPMTEETWNQMLKMLEAMKPALVEKSDSDSR